MHGRIGYLGCAVAVAMCLFVFSASAQEAGETTEVGAELQWAWAEVSSVDPVAQAIIVNYLDYETDSEKEMTIVFDAATVFENVTSSVEIKPTDTVSVDYLVTPDGKNLAKTITVEKATGEVPAEDEQVKIPRENEAVSATPESPEAVPAVAVEEEMPQE